MPIVKVSAVFQVESNKWQFGQGLDVGSTDWATLGAAYNGAVTDNLVPLLGSDCSFMGTQWADVGGRITAGSFVPVEAETLGGGAPSLPSAAPIAVTCFNGEFGRGKQGRFFLSGIPNDQYEGDDLTADALTGFQTAFAAFYVALTGAGLAPVTIRYVRDETGKVTSPPTVDSTAAVLRYIVRPIIRSQRRRQQGRSIKGRPITP